MYKIFHNIDGEKTTVLNTDEEFIEFVKMIQKENEDTLFPSQTVRQCMYYIIEFCENLTLTIEK